MLSMKATSKTESITAWVSFSLFLICLILYPSAIGHIIYDEGLEYRGEFAYGNHHGKGVMTFQGSSWDGQFVDRRLQGEFTVKRPNGRQTKERFEQAPDYDVYTGEIVGELIEVLAEGQPDEEEKKE